MSIMRNPVDVGDTVAVWDDVLRSFAAALDDQRAFLLTAGEDDLSDVRVLLPPTFEPPASLPPMPDQFAGWARSLLAEVDGLTQFAADVLARMPAPAPRVPRLIETGAITGRTAWDRSM
jgi:hypothetical protein